jgi:hypothetical protein
MASGSESDNDNAGGAPPVLIPLEAWYTAKEVADRAIFVLVLLQQLSHNLMRANIVRIAPNFH